MGARIAVHRRQVDGEPAGDVEVRASEARRRDRFRGGGAGARRRAPAARPRRLPCPGRDRRARRLELRLKESDRIEGVVDGLRRIGGHIRATRDGSVSAECRQGCAAGRSTAAVTTGWPCSARSPDCPRSKASSSSAPMPSRRASRLLRRSGSCRRVGGKNRAMIVTIDGPAGSGKSTVAAALAQRLVPAPRHRRDVPGSTWLALGQGSTPTTGTPRDACPRASGHLRRRGARGDRRVRRVDGDPGGGDRSRRAPVAANQGVREVMRERQRALGSVGDAVIEGRDIGTVVAPAPR